MTLIATDIHKSLILPAKWQNWNRPLYAVEICNNHRKFSWAFKMHMSKLQKW